MFSADEGWRVAETMFKFTFQFICDCSVCIGGAFRTSVTVKPLQTQRGVLCYNERICFQSLQGTVFNLSVMLFQHPPLSLFWRVHACISAYAVHCLWAR